MNILKTSARNGKNKKIDHFKDSLLSLKYVGLDSMCFIYQFSDHPIYAPLTDLIISLLQENKITAVTSTIAVVEIFIHEEKIGDALTINAYERTLKTLPNLEIVPIDWQVARLASKLRAKYQFLKTPDALQIAAALLSDCKCFITNDSKLKKIKEIKVISFGDFVYV